MGRKHKSGFPATENVCERKKGERVCVCVRLGRKTPYRQRSHEWKERINDLFLDTQFCNINTATTVKLELQHNEIHLGVVFSFSFHSIAVYSPLIKTQQLFILPDNIRRSKINLLRFTNTQVAAVCCCFIFCKNYES